MTRITIKIDTGSQFVKADDEARAIAAAEKVIAAGGSHEDAESAANIALTEGWHDTNGAYCSLTIGEQP